MAAVNSANLQTRIIAMLTAGFEERKEVFRAAYLVMKGRVRNEIKVDQIHEDKATRCDRVEDWLIRKIGVPGSLIGMKKNTFSNHINHFKTNPP